MDYAADFAYEDLENLTLDFISGTSHWWVDYTSQLLVIYSDSLHGLNKYENLEIRVFEYRKATA